MGIVDSHTWPEGVGVEVVRIDYGHVGHDSGVKRLRLVNSTAGCDRSGDMVVAYERLPSVRVCLF